MKFKTGFVVQLVNHTSKKKNIRILNLTVTSHFKWQKKCDSMEITSTVIFPKPLLSYEKQTPFSGRREKSYKSDHPPE